MSAGIIAGNTGSITILSATVDLGSVAANTSETETATVTGVKTTDIIVGIKPTLEAGLLIGTCWVSAADTVSIQVGNLTASPINAASETWKFIVFRPDNPNTTVSKVIT